jgi:hypothetical protein
MGKLSSACENANASAAYLYGAMNFIPGMAIHLRISNSFTRWRGILKGLSQDGGQADYSKNLSASFFNKGLTNEPNLGRIHLVEQYL